MSNELNKAINDLREKVYYYISSQSSNRGFVNFQYLEPKFDQELLNDIAKLKSINSTDVFASQVADIRGKLMICRTAELIGHKDEEDLQKMFDEIENLYKEG